jgi:hypothetical protein
MSFRNVSEISFLRSVRRLLVTANVPSSPILVTMIKEALSASETTVLTRPTRRNIPEDAVLHSHLPERPQILHILIKLAVQLVRTNRFAKFSVNSARLTERIARISVYVDVIFRPCCCCCNISLSLRPGMTFQQTACRSEDPCFIRSTEEMDI